MRLASVASGFSRTGLVLLSMVPWLVQSRAAQRSAPGAERQVSVRVHHLHFRVGDPAAAMQEYASRFGGTRVLLQGLGVGVRLGTHYLLFDRDRGRTGSSSGGDIGAAYRAAVPWLAAHGAAVQAGDDLADLPVALLGDAGPLDHIAFAAADYVATIEVLSTRGAQPVSRTDDAALFRLPDGVLIEIVKETDLPDAYWCPMHLDVRSGAPGKCPICGMTLVPIPPPRIGEYRMDITVMPGARGRGLGGLRIVLRDPESGQLVPAFSLVHERLLHLFIVSRSLEYFAHVHPESAGPGVFRLQHEAPPGAYVVIADFVPQGGTTQMVHRAIVTPGYEGPMFAPAPVLTPDIPESPRFSVDPGRVQVPTGRAAEKTVDGLRIRLEAADLVAGKRGTLRFWLNDAASGAPVTDLDPFLGAPGHMLIVDRTLTEAIHGHPEEQDTHAPFVTFLPLLPAPGVYKLWVQFQRHGRVITAPFVIAAAGP